MPAEFLIEGIEPSRNMSTVDPQLRIPGAHGLRVWDDNRTTARHFCCLKTLPALQSGVTGKTKYLK
jgi:hypothetical protein